MPMNLTQCALFEVNNYTTQRMKTAPRKLTRSFPSWYLTALGSSSKQLRGNVVHLSRGSNTRTHVDARLWGENERLREKRDAIDS